MAARNFLNGAPLLTLSSGINDSAVTLSVSSTSGYPAQPFTIALERGTINEEVVLCTGVGASTFTVTRGYDGTTAKSHSSGAVVEHTTTAVDYADANSHIYNVALNHHTQYTLKTLWAAKGSIVVASGASTPVNVSVGANDTVFVADSAQASGTKWATIGGASIASGAISFTKLDTASQQSLVQRVTTGTLPSPVTGQVVATTDNNRLVAYLAAAWLPVAHGVGRIYTSSGSPSGGADGDLWMQYV